MKKPVLWQYAVEKDSSSLHRSNGHSAEVQHSFSFASALESANISLLADSIALAQHGGGLVCLRLEPRVGAGRLTW